MKQRRRIVLFRPWLNTYLKYLLLCPSCKKAIPTIVIQNSKGETYIRYTCFCSNKFPVYPLPKFLKKIESIFKAYYQHPRRKIIRRSKTKYCLNCKEFLCPKCLKKHQKHYRHHSLIAQTVQISCPFHDNIHYSYACTHSNRSFCYKCKRKTSFHPLTELEPVDLRYYRKSMGLIIKQIEKNMKATTRFITREKEEDLFYDKNTEAEDYDKTFKENKITIAKFYNYNRFRNGLFTKLIKCITITGLALRHHPTFQIYNMYEGIQLNKTKPLYCDDSEIDYKLLQVYFLTNFIIDQKPLFPLVHTMDTHTDFIWCLVMLQDKNIASSSKDTTIKIWNIKDYQCITSLKGHDASVRALLQLRDGSLLSGSADESIKQWDLKTFTCKATLIGHYNWINCMTLLANGHIVSGADDCKVKIWDLSTRKCIKTLDGHDGFINDVLELFDSRVVSASGDSTLNIWDLQSGKAKKLIGHKANVWSCIQLIDGRLVSASEDTFIRIWNVNRMTCLRVISVHKRWVKCLIQLSDGRIASGGYDAEIIMLNLKTNTMKSINTETKETHMPVPNCLLQISDNEIASGVGMSLINIWKFK